MAATRMTDTEMRLWRERLLQANRMWTEMGFTGESAAKGVLKALYGYRGKQWENPGWGGFNEEDLIVVNLLFGNTNTMLSQISSRPPGIIVKPRNQAAVSAAPIVERILKYYMQILKMKREHDLCGLDASLMPVGIMRHGFTPRIEFYDQADGTRLEVFGGAEPDVPWMRKTPVWDVRLDPRCSYFGSDRDAAWVMFRDLMTIDEIKANPAMTAPRDLHATVSWDKIASTPYPQQRLQLDGPDGPKFVEIWSAYDFRERKWFQFSPTGTDKLLRQPADWPIPWGSLPFEALAFNPQSDTMFPVAFTDIEWKLYIEANKVRTIMNELVKRLRRIVFLNPEGLAVGETEKLIDDVQLMEFVRTNGADPNTILKEVQIGGSDLQGLLNYYGQIKEDLREIRGIGNMDRGQRINVDTATEAADVQQGSDIHQERILEKWEDFWSGNVAKWVKGLQRTATRDIIVPLIGDQDLIQLTQPYGRAGGFLTATPQQIQGEFLFEIEAGSTTQAKRQQDIQNEVAWIQLTGKEQMVNQQQSLQDLAVAFGKDPSRSLITPQHTEATTQGLAAKGVQDSDSEPPQIPQSGAGAQPAVNPALLQQLSSITGAGGGMVH